MPKIIEYVDVGKTRRRIEDSLRKYAIEARIISIAAFVGVEVAKIFLPEVSGEEIRFAESFEKQLDNFFQLPEEERKTLSTPRLLSPKKFVVYYASWPRYPNDNSPARRGPNCFTKEAAERFCSRKEDTVTKLPQDIIDMRERVRGTNPKDLLVEDRETFKRLKQLLFPAK